MQTMNPAILPGQQADPYSRILENLMLAVPRGRPQVVFLGDSVMQWFATGAGAAVWQTWISPLRADNFAVPGATTSDVLWQLDNGQLSGTSPSVIVLMIGINNLVYGQMPGQTAAGIAAIAETLANIQPQARLLVEGLLPADADPNGLLRQEVRQTNGLVSSLAGPLGFSYLDVGQTFLLPGDLINPALSWDYIHPNDLGYLYLTSALLPTLNALVKAGPLTGPRPSAVTQFFSGTTTVINNTTVSPFETIDGGTSANATQLFTSPVEQFSTGPTG